MTPPCLNCHGAASSQPDSIQNWVYFQDEPSRDYYGPKDYPRTCKKDCSAETDWPEWLQTPLPERQKSDFWVRSNFEKFIKYRRTPKFQPTLPLRIKLGDARVDLDLKVRPGKIQIGDNTIQLATTSDASIKAFFKIQDNQIPLWQKSLVKFHGIGLGTKKSILSLGVLLQELGISPSGGLHLLLKPGPVTKDLLEIFSHLDILKKLSPPQGEAHFPDVDCYVAKDILMKCRQYETAFYLNRFLPQEFTDGSPSKRLPRAFDLEDLLYRLQKKKNRDIQEYFSHPWPFQISSSQKKASFEFDWWSTLKPGSKLSVRISDLRDLFLPGLLDLGPSQAVVVVQKDTEDTVIFTLPKFTLNVDPMELPYHWDEKRPPIRINSGTFSPGPAQNDTTDSLHSIPLEPGIKVQWNKKLGTLDFQINVNMSLEIEMPGGGISQMKGNFQGKLYFLQTNDGWKLVPKENFLALKDLMILDPEGKPWVQDANILISDRPDVSPELNTFINPPKAYFHITGIVNEGYQIDNDGYLAIPRNHDGSYAWENLLPLLNLNSHISLTQMRSKPKDPLKQYQAAVKVSPLDSNSIIPVSLDYPGALPPVSAAYRIDLDLYGPEGNPARDGAIITGAKIYLAPGQAIPKTDFLLDLSADQIHWKGLKIQDLKTYLEVERLHISEGVSSIRVPAFFMEGNPKGSGSGPLQGPFFLKQASGETMHFFWDSPYKKIGVENFDLSFGAKGIHLMPQGILKLLDPRIHSTGLDGHLKADFLMNFAGPVQDWNGAGLISLRGDSNGDVYFLDRRGKQVGEPLLRNTRWNFKRVDRINTQRGYLLGDFFLELWANLSGLRNLGADPKVVAKDPTVATTGMGSYEFRFRMPYDNQPWNVTGFQNRIADYVRTVCWESKPCREKLPGYTPRKPKKEGTP